MKLSKQKAYKEARKRAEEMLEKMNLTEKVGQISQFGTSIYTNDEQYFEDHFEEGKVGSYLTIRGAEKTNRIQEMLLAITRLKIPALFAEDVIHGYKTIAPIPLAQSCSWEPELTEKCCSDAAEECYKAGIKWTFSPMVDIARDPRWGRIAEGYGEDTYLCSDYARAAVRGYQGDEIGKKGKVLACMKHYVAYGAGEGGRDYDSVDMSLQTLYDVYLPSFKAGIDEGAATVMSAFNDVNGVPCTGNKFLLRDVLRKQLGFEGFVVSDAMAVDELMAHGYAKDGKEAAEKAFGSGVDIVMAGDRYNDNIPALIEEGKIDPALVDESVKNILTIKYMLGLFENPYVDPEEEATGFYSEKAMKNAEESAKNSIVLLENDGVLPLKGTEKIALIGPMADDKNNVFGTWVIAGEYEHNITVADGMKKYFKDLTIEKACGYLPEEDENIDGAVKKAAEADVIIACVGEARDMSGEARSRSDLGLPGNQKELMEKLFATGKKVVMLVSAGRPLVLTEYKDKAAAIVCTWHLGTTHGDAVAKVLMGEHNPSGHLSTSFPRRTGQVPVYYNHYSTGRPALGKVPHEAKYFDCEIGALYPFGYGKSYTEFEYSSLKLSSDKMKADGEIDVTVNVKNTGEYGGADVIQLYVRDLIGSRVRPVAELKGYKKLYLEKGEEKTVTFKLSACDLAFTNNEMQRVTEPGDFKLWVAHDSSDKSLEADFAVIE